MTHYTTSFAIKQPVGLLLSAPRAGDIDRLQAPALSSKRGQCHVDSRGTRLNTDLLNRERVRLFCSNTQNEI